MLRSVEWIRRGLACTAAVCFFLPLAQCTHKDEAPEIAPAVAGSAPAGASLPAGAVARPDAGASPAAVQVAASAVPGVAASAALPVVPPGAGAAATPLPVAASAPLAPDTLVVAHFPINDMAFWFWLALFVWPLAALLLRHRAHARLWRGIVAALEIVAGSASLYWLVEVIRLWGTVRYGGVIALASFAGLVVVACADFVCCARGPRASRS